MTQRDLELGEVARLLAQRRAYLVADLARLLGVHANTVRWRVTMGRYRAENFGERQTWVISASVLEDLRRLNPEAMGG
jgi:transposase-like protein